MSSTLIVQSTASYGPAPYCLVRVTISPPAHAPVHSGYYTFACSRQLPRKVVIRGVNGAGNLLPYPYNLSVSRKYPNCRMWRIDRQLHTPDEMPTKFIVQFAGIRPGLEFTYWVEWAPPDWTEGAQQTVDDPCCAVM